MSYPKFEIKKSLNDQFYFNLHARNAQIILTSEMYVAKQSCKEGIDSVKNNSKRDANYEKKTSSNGKCFFNLKAMNGEIIGTSEMYESIQSRDSGIESVKTNAPIAIVSDFS